MNLPINLIDHILYKRIIICHLNIVLAETIGIYACKYLNEMQKLVAIYAWQTREIFRPLYNLEIKNLHS